MAHLKEEDDHHKRWGDERRVKAPSHELAHISATEGTERGRRGGIAPAWVALPRSGGPAVVGSRFYRGCNTSCTGTKNAWIYLSFLF